MNILAILNIWTVIAVLYQCVYESQMIYQIPEATADFFICSSSMLNFEYFALALVLLSNFCTNSPSLGDGGGGGQ